MSDRLVAWVLRVAWAVVPFVVWPALGEALRPHSAAIRTAAAAGAWVVWAAVLMVTLVPHPLGLTTLRCTTPALLVAAVVGAATGRGSLVAATAAIVWSAGLLIGSLLPRTALVFVNGQAYPNERRYPLAPPGPLLVGPIELAWLAAVGLPVAALFLLASGQWVPGAVAVVAAGAAARYLGRPLHRLSRRWAVFVPAGFVLHDPMALREPVLFSRTIIGGLSPASTVRDGLDLTLGAPGTVLQLDLRQPVPVVPVTDRRRAGDEVTAERIFFTPTRPGAVLDEANRRHIRVGTAGR